MDADVPDVNPRDGGPVSHSSDTVSDKRIFDLSFNVALRLTLVAFLIIWCFLILRPFMIVLLWAVILAVAFQGVFEKLCGMVGGRRGVAATVFSILSIALIVYPSYMIGGSLVGSIRSVQEAMAEGTLQAPPPPEWLGNVPAVGERANEAWLLASDDLQEAVVQFEPQLRAAGRWLLGFLAGIGGAVLRTMLALIIAAALLTYSEPATRALRAVTGRVQGDWDEDFVGMAGATINSVARGVLGVALFQTMICGAGLFFVGFPGAGLLTIAVLVLAIVQFPVIVPMALPLIWGFTNMGTLAAIAFAVFCVAASAADMPLKAMFLGRGVSVPTAVILLGAIGGMVSMGIMGLFIGSVVLGIGYKLFQAWLAGGRLPDATPMAPANT
jgi:predicted PurR-regulated permease PerM